MKGETTEINDELTYRIIGMAMQIRRILGFGFLNAAYDEALIFEFERHQMQFARVALGMQSNKEDGETGLSGFLVENQLMLFTRTGPKANGKQKKLIQKKLKASKMKEALMINFTKGNLEWQRVVAK